MKLRPLFGIGASVAVAAALLAGGFPVGPASAQTDAKVRVVHFSPDAPAVDVYVDGKVRSKNLAYERASPYIDVPAGKHTFAVRPTGSAPESAAVITSEATLTGGKAYTFAALGKVAAIQGKLFEDDNTPPAAGKVKLRVIHAAPDVPAVDIAPKGGEPLVKALTFPNASPYLTLDAGNYEVEVRAAGTTTALLSSTVVLAEGGVYSVAAIGGADKAAKLRGLIDLAAGSAPPSTAAAATTAATPSTAAAAGATTTAAGATTAAAGATTTAAAATTTAAPTTVAPTTVAPTTVAPTTAAPTTAAAPVDTEAPVETAAPVDTEATTETVPSTEPAVPAGGAGTGAGGLTGTGGSLTLAGLLAIAAATLGMATIRRRRA